MACPRPVALQQSYAHPMESLNTCQAARAYVHCIKKDITIEERQLTEDWTFADLKRVETLWGPHGYHRYPAKFIPQLVHRIIESYSVPGELVGDPFVGSATTGIEALRLGRRFWGSDIS